MAPSSYSKIRTRELEVDGEPVTGGSGGGPVAIDDVTGLQDVLDDLESRLAALESAGD